MRDYYQSPPQMPPVQPGGSAPPRSTRPRWRHSPWTVVIVIVACWALGGAAGGVVLWTRPAKGCDEDASIVIDEQAGVCYQIPPGWQQRENQEFIMSITSMIGKKAAASDDQPAVVVAGRWQNFFEKAPRGTSLGNGAGSLGASFAEFFFPDPGERNERSSHDETIYARRAGTASFRIDFTDPSSNPPTYIRCTVVETKPGEVAFVFGAAPSTQPGAHEDVDMVHGSLAVR